MEVQISPPLALFPQTYISATSTLVVTFTNTSKKMKKINFRSSAKEKCPQKTTEIDVFDASERINLNKRSGYNSTNFKFEIENFELWPGGSKQILLSFSPTIAMKHEETIYICDDSGSQPIPFKVSGIGLPPVAEFLTSTIQVGRVGLDDIHDYEVVLANCGKVGLDYELEEHDCNGIQFQFNPSNGHLDSNEEVKVHVRFIASYVCTFTEKFVYRIKGVCGSHPEITFTGKVVGPTFQITPAFIDFGCVGLNFMYSKKIMIENTSNMSFDFSLSLQYNGGHDKREVRIEPESSHLEKFKKKEITIEFIPTSVRNYEMKIDLNIDRYQNAVESISMTAKCICPTLKLRSQILDFGNIFIGFPSKKTVFLENDSDFSAKFDFINANEDESRYGTISTDHENGFVMPHSVYSFDLTLIGKFTGNIELNVYFKIVGSSDDPIPLCLHAICTGPSIKYSCNTINFGNVPILKEETRTIEITNNSSILAEFRAQVEQSSSTFSIDKFEGKIQPGETFLMNVSAKLSDNLAFQGRIRFAFNCLSLSFIPLLAIGTGTPIVSSIDMKMLDLGYILTKQPIIKKFILTNTSKRATEIRTSHTKPRLPKDCKGSISFEIKPDIIMLQPNESREFSIEISSDSIVAFTCQVQVHSTVNRVRTDIYDLLVKGSFVDPLLTFSQQNIEFMQSTVPLNRSSENLLPTMGEMKVMECPLVVANQSKIPMSIKVDCPEPFGINVNEFVLPPNESNKLIVVFNPLFKEDFNSETIVKKLIFTCDNHPIKMIVGLKGTISFPNISFDKERNLDFGVMMKNTERTITVNLAGHYDGQIQYRWEILSKDEMMNKVFDIFPIRGIIEPNETAEAHFSFMAMSSPNGESQIFNADAVCHVKGGPDYLFKLKGQSASIDYKIEPKLLSFGKIHFLEQSTQTLTIENTSTVPIEFKARASRGMKLDQFSVTPSSGKIEAKHSLELTVSIVPGTPAKFSEMFIIQIGNFEENQITVEADALFPQVLLSLPRSENDPATLMLIEEAAALKASSSKRAIETAKTDHSCDSDDEDQVKEVFTDQQLLDKEKEIMCDIITRRSNTPSIFGKQAVATPSQKLSEASAISEYVLDYGTIILGQELTKKIKVRNLAMFPISFTMDVNCLKKTGFKVESISFKDIPSEKEETIIVNFKSVNRKVTDVGEIEYRIPLTFNDGHHIDIILKCIMKLPVIELSQHHFDFGKVIIGQRKIMSLQLQNMNSVSVEFSIGDAEQIDIIKKTSQKADDKPIFAVVPNKGILPPSSYINLSIQFAPCVHKHFQMQFPVKLVHSPDHSYVTVSGSGAQLMLQFNPPELELPTITPFSKPTYASFTVHNPTDSPIDFLSLQFDSKLNQEEGENQREAESPFVTYTPKVRVSNLAAKFSVCIIVDGGPMSGKTTLARSLSKAFNLPLISLDEIWKDVSPNDRVAKLVEQISLPQNLAGFVIDGFKPTESNETDESFLSQCLKQKKDIFDDINVHPNQIFKIPQEYSSYQSTMNTVIQSLDGQYVFYISLQTSPAEIVARKEKLEQREKRRAKKAKEEEINKLLEMTEEEYAALSPTKQAIVDAERSKFREDKKLKIQPETEPKKTNGSKKLAPENKVKSRTSISNDKAQHNEKGQQKKKKANKVVPEDPLQFLTLTYLLSAGSIMQKLSVSGERIKAIDPSVIKDVQRNPNASCNSITINASSKQRVILEEAINFLPQITKLKEYAFKGDIPAPSVSDCNETIELMKLSPKIPKHFYIIEADTNTKTNSKNQDIDLQNGSRPLTNRWHLEPNQDVSLVVVFDPLYAIGNLTDNLQFLVEKSSSPPAILKVRGLCAIPSVNIEPSSLFERVSNKFDPKIMSPTFYTDTNTLHFGYCLPAVKDKSKGGMKCTAKLTIANTCKITTNVSLCIIDSQPKQATWHIDPLQLKIPESEKGEATIGFSPATVGVFETKVGIFIQDNPEPYIFNVVGECCSPTIDLYPQTIDFEKILITSEKTKKVEIRNTGKVAAYWRIKGGNSNAPIVTFGVTEGMIPPRSSAFVPIKFGSPKQISFKKSIAFEVLGQDEEQVFGTSQVLVVGEAFDINFDISFTKSLTPDSLNFGTIKVGQTKSFVINLKNRGKYPVSYQIKLSEKLGKSFIMEPMNATVSPSDKNPTITATFASNALSNYNVSDGMKIAIIDTQTKSVQAELSYPVVASAVFNTYTVSCGKKIDFGINTSTANVTKEFTIKNTGVFPFEYEIRMKSDKPEDVKQTTRKLPPIQKQQQKNKKAIQQPTGPLLIYPLSGTIHPGAETKFNAEFNTSSPGVYNVVYQLLVSDASKADSVFPLKLSGTSCKPGISFTQPEKLFPKLPICIRVDIDRKEMDCFIEDEMILHFMPRLINTSIAVPLVLINAQPIECQADIIIKGKGKGQQPFDVADKTLLVPANGNAKTTITFCPTTSDSFTSAMEINIRGGITAFKCGLEGIGSLPSISLLTQLDKVKNSFTFNMGKTLLGSDKSKTITFVNDKKIPATVCVNAKANPDFEIKGIESSTFTVDPGMQFNIINIYKPLKTGKSTLDMSVTVADNPKLQIPITIAGEGCSEDVQFCGLGDDNDLHFNDSIAGRPTSATFTIKNLASDDIKFSLTTPLDITFVPSVGHIKSGFSKEISATFVSDKPTKLTQGKCACQLQRITLDPDAPEWDNSMKIVTFKRETEEVPIPEKKTNGRESRVKGRQNRDAQQKKQSSAAQKATRTTSKLVRVTTVHPEPEFKVVKGAKSHDVQLKIFAVVDQIKWSIDTTDIPFAPTMMFQQRFTEIKLTNTCNVRFEYAWHLREFQSLRTDYLSFNVAPFTIIPSTGFVEAGQTATFKIVFSPLEVDDFKGKFVCDIAYLSGASPVVEVSGISKRPVCHFNIEESDYLLHRHPDFTSPIPSGTHVIEIFSSAPRVKSVKKIEMINPTSEAYETRWTLISGKNEEIIKCDNKGALVSSGKHYNYSFTFFPKDNRLVEALYMFEVVDQNIQVPMLFVGRIQH